jgi:hypothetical protein
MLGYARIWLGSARGWATAAARLALGWALGRAPGWVARPRAALGWAPADRAGLESRLVPDELAPSLRIRFQSPFPRAGMFASLAPMIAGLVPFCAVWVHGEAVTPLTGGGRK